MRRGCLRAVQRIPRDIRGAIEIVASPAMGGVIAGHELARALGVEALFVERPSGHFELRRGFRLKPGQKVLLMEDVVTTGLSSREAIKAIERPAALYRGAALVAARAVRPIWRAFLSARHLRCLLIPPIRFPTSSPQFRREAGERKAA